MNQLRPPLPRPQSQRFHPPFQAALAACKDAIDRLKERVPLWKKEVYESGEEWIGRGS